MDVWDEYFSEEDLKAKWGGIFPISLAKRAITEFSKEGEIVLDPFCGTGSTLIAAKSLGRLGKGLEISNNQIKLASQRGVIPTKGSVFNITKYFEKNSIDLIFTSPPYWTQLAKFTDYTIQGEMDLGKLQSYEDFLIQLKGAWTQIILTLKAGGKCVVLVKDLRDVGGGNLPSDLIKILEELGLNYIKSIEWDKRGKIAKARGKTIEEIPKTINETLICFIK